ncbi:RNA signal recognition particle [Marinobacterium aestuarii]|uniref:RNA signal recognition particle n=1 Tax=Marinobacterium aestuarii TaxID=1821621 RepID=A0A1A9F1T7_9GAMM|nr:DUF1428 domain-containing protein [Marinobacterium aestuarii]ANG63851.1 RNA signal recognition particle [Marinobacterium aestuarii]
MNYVDGDVIAVPRENKEKYIELARNVAAVFKKHGALNLVECWGDDVPEGKVTSFPMAVQCKENEVVVFAWITWPSKAVRDTGMADAMADPLFANQEDPMPFDGKRMIFGGFQMIVNE